MAWHALLKTDVISVLEQEGMHLTHGQKQSCTLLNEQVIQSGNGVIEALNEVVLDGHFWILQARKRK